MTTDIEAIAACGARIVELEAERDALRTVLTPSQRKRFDAQWQPREEGER